jgi:hypothetical protein
VVILSRKTETFDGIYTWREDINQMNQKNMRIITNNGNDSIIGIVT